LNGFLGGCDGEAEDFFGFGVGYDAYGAVFRVKLGFCVGEIDGDGFMGEGKGARSDFAVSKVGEKRHDLFGKKNICVPVRFLCHFVVDGHVFVIGQRAEAVFKRADVGKFFFRTEDDVYGIGFDAPVGQSGDQVREKKAECDRKDDEREGDKLFNHSAPP